jgi:hypothetical protein
MACEEPFDVITYWNGFGIVARSRRRRLRRGGTARTATDPGAPTALHPPEHLVVVSKLCQVTERTEPQKSTGSLLTPILALAPAATSMSPWVRGR